MSGSSLGKRLRHLRTSLGKSLEQVAANVGSTKGHLSKVERDVAAPSIALLTRLASEYGVPPGEIVNAIGVPEPISLVRADDRLSVARDGAGRGYSYEAIAYRKSDRRIEAYVIEMKPHLEIEERFRHPGQELFYVLEGEVSFLFGDRTYRLSPGDCLYFDAMVEHRGDAFGDAPARALAIIVPEGGQAVAEALLQSVKQETQGRKP